MIRLLLGISCLFIFCRFLYPGDAVFIIDEPSFQLKLEEHMAAGTWPLTSFRGSSIPLPYGAGAFYFYWPLRLITALPEAIVLYHVFFVSLCALFLYLALKNIWDKKTAAWALFAASTSPLLFLFSRHIWDNALFYPLSGLLLYLFSLLGKRSALDQKSYFLLAAIGFVVGYAINIHLMFGSVAMGTGLSVLYFCFSTQASWRKKILGVFVFSAVCAIVLAPYLWEAYRLMQAEQEILAAHRRSRWGDGRDLWWTLQRTAIFSSLWGSKVYFQGLQEVFYSYVGKTWAFFFHNDLFGWFGKIAAWSLPFWVMASWLKRKKPNLVFVFGAFCFFSTLIVILYLNIPTDPHYYNPIWWFVFLGIGWAAYGLKSWARKAFLSTVVLTAFVNVAFLFYSFRFVHENRGARNMYYSTVMAEQQRLVTSLCEDMGLKGRTKALLDIGHVAMGPFSFRYHLKHLPACQGKTVEVGAHLNGADYVLHYPVDSSTSAALAY